MTRKSASVQSMRGLTWPSPGACSLWVGTGVKADRSQQAPTDRRVMRKRIPSHAIPQSPARNPGIGGQQRVQQGYSLSELLVAMTVLMLVGAIMVAGIPSAFRAYTNVVDASNAQVLLATTATRLRDELSMANPDKGTMEINASNVVTSFTSLETGYKVTFLSDDKGDLCKREQAIGVGASSTSEAIVTPLIPTKSTRTGRVNLCATYDGITYNKSKGVFEVKNLRVVAYEPVEAGNEEDDSVSSEEESAGLITGDTYAGAHYQDVLEIRVLAAPQG